MKTTPKFKSLSDRYTKASSTIATPRIISANRGEVGTGKTFWALGAPGPILVQSMDLGLEGVVESFAEDKDIYVATYDMGASIDSPFTHEAALEARTKFTEDFEHALGKVRTIIWDRETDVWNMHYYAEFGTDDAYGAAPAKDWDKLKGRIRRMIAMAKATPVNFILIQGMKNEWTQKTNPNTGKKAGVQTGNRVRSGMDDLEALVHHDILHIREGGEFGIHVDKSRGPGGMALQDQTLMGVDFVEFAKQVFPGTTDKDWQ